jgi:hypothetical protein
MKRSLVAGNVTLPFYGVAFEELMVSGGREPTLLLCVLPDSLIISFSNKLSSPSDPH